MAIINFGGTKEEVITRKEFPMARARKVLKNETIAIIGYGVQGPAQSLNLRDNGFKVIIGQASAFKRDWDRAVKDGWVPGKTLFEIEEAVRRGHHHPDAGVGRRAARHLAGGQEEPEARRRALFLARLLHRLQEADRGGSAEERGRDHGRAQGLRHVGAPQFPDRARASTRASPSSRTPPAAPRSAAWRSASASARATCSRPRSSTRCSAI